MRQYSVDKSGCYKSKTLDFLPFSVLPFRLINIRHYFKLYMTVVRIYKDGNDIEVKFKIYQIMKYDL